MHTLKMGAILALLMALVAMGAPAATLNAGHFTTGSASSTVTVGGVDYSLLAFGGGGLLGTKTVAGVTGIGVTGGPAGNEIDFGEALTLSTSNQVMFSYIDIAFLYANGNMGDTVNEVAAYNWAVGTAVVSVTSPTTATLTGSPGSIMNLSPGDNSGAGLWRIIAPFGNASISEVNFQAICVAGTNCGIAANSDFALAGFGATAIPEPATYGFMGLGLAGLAYFRRRRRLSQR